MAKKEYLLVAILAALVMVCSACTESIGMTEDGMHATPELKSWGDKPIVGKLEAGKVTCSMTEGECKTAIAKFTNEPVLSTEIVKINDQYYLLGRIADAAIYRDIEVDGQGNLRLMLTGEKCSGCPTCDLNGSDCFCDGDNSKVCSFGLLNPN